MISIVMLAHLLIVSGCSQLGLKNYVVFEPRSDSASSSVGDQERRFAAALELLRTGKEQAARDLLEKFVEDSAPGAVIDEALFRLSLLSLRDEGSKGSMQAIELLDRLKSEYPKSIWTHQAAPLSAYLTNVKLLRDRQREVKSLKDHNLSLSRDNREMRQSIERLKSLDLELEKKIKR